MKVEFRASFEKDLRKIKDAPVKKQILEVIALAEKAQNLQDMEHAKKLKSGEGFYRIRLGDYRMGLMVEKGAIVFVRFLHHKGIYRYFP